MSLYRVSVPTFRRSLVNLSSILVKAEEHAATKGIEMEVLLTSRLIADMHPLHGQIQMASDSARRGAAMLAGYAMANFFFHVTTAYNILRANGVSLGKLDFLGAP